MFKRHPKSVLKLQQLNALYLVTSGVPDRLTRLQNLAGLTVRCEAPSKSNLFADNIGTDYCSKRTANRILVNLARDHDSGLLARKEKEEKVLAATTWKQARSLAKQEDFGGSSCFSDNAGKVKLC